MYFLGLLERDLLRGLLRDLLRDLLRGLIGDLQRDRGLHSATNCLYTFPLGEIRRPVRGLILRLYSKSKQGSHLPRMRENAR